RDVMGAEHEEVLLLPDPGDERPEDRPPGEVEGLERALPRETPGLALGVGRSPEVVEREVDGAGGLDLLDSRAPGLRIGRSQRLVAPHDLVEGGAEDAHVEAAPEAVRVRHVVAGPRSEPVEEEQALLRERERQRTVSGDARDDEAARPSSET